MNGFDAMLLVLIISYALMATAAFGYSIVLYVGIAFRREKPMAPLPFVRGVILIGLLGFVPAAIALYQPIWGPSTIDIPLWGHLLFIAWVTLSAVTAIITVIVPAYMRQKDQMAKAWNLLSSAIFGLFISFILMSVTAVSLVQFFE